MSRHIHLVEDTAGTPDWISLAVIDQETSKGQRSGSANTLPNFHEHIRGCLGWISKVVIVTPSKEMYDETEKIEPDF